MSYASVRGRRRLCGRECIFRLYFVDAPEVDDSFPDRNRERTRHSCMTAKENRKAGEATRTLTAHMLRKPFTVSNLASAVATALARRPNESRPIGGAAAAG